MNKTLLVVVLVLTLAGCKTAPTGETVPDWAKIDVAGDEIIGVIDGQVVTWQHRPEVVHDLMNVRRIVADIDAAVDLVIAGGEPFDLDSAIIAAISVLDDLVANTADPDLRATYSSLRAALGTIRVVLA